ncbi:MAG: TraB/GumN family protein [Rhizobiaceae bacterium]
MISASLVIRALRSPEAILRLAAAANALFFASFLVILLTAASTAQAEGAVCGGQDMLASMTPEALKTVEAEASKTVNGENRLWKIEKAGLKPSYLFGTMHMTDPRVISLTAEAQAVYDGADIVVIETTEILDQKKAAAALMAKPELMMFTDKTTLTSLVKPEDLPALEQGLKARGIPLVAVNKMKPWMIAGLVALPACELQRKKDGAPFLDIKLAKDAQAAGKELDGLETMAEQISAMAALPIEFHVQGLVETVKLGSKMEDVMETMITLYTQGRIGMIMPFLKSVSPDDTGDAENYGDFEEVMINARNKVMAGRAEAILAKGNAFIAVGGLHLPGAEGLVEKFRNAGYAVTAAGK